MLLAASAPNDRRGKIVMWTLVVVVCCCCAFLGVEYLLLKLDVAFARGQVATFEAMKLSAEATTDARKMAEILEYVVNYYPSGTKQRKGSALDSVVEMARSNTTTFIIVRLRATTAKDLGGDPNAWLKEYVRDK
jgi:hypothetical protein